MSSGISTYTQICDQIRTVASHSYLLQQIGKPPVPYSFIRFLSVLLHSTSISEKRQQVFIRAVTFLYMALVVHEWITVNEESNPDEIRKRQLTVLAGDFFSSLFYQELANAHEIDGIGALAKATSQINYDKMQNYFAASSKQVHMFTVEQTVVHHLLTAVADFFLVEEKYVWSELIHIFVKMYDGKNREAKEIPWLSIVNQCKEDEVKSDLCSLFQELEGERK